MAGEAHVRIDEGIKRGPKQQRASVPRRRNEKGLVEGIPANLDPKEVLELYLTEANTSQIAKRYGVRRKTLVGWLREVAPKEWKRVQTVRAEIRKEDGNENIEVAPDALSLARAREMIRSAQWDLERLDAENYGQKQEITHNINTDLGDRLRRARERTIDAQVIDVAPQPLQSSTTITDQSEPGTGS